MSRDRNVAVLSELSRLVSESQYSAVFSCDAIDAVSMSKFRMGCAIRGIEKITMYKNSLMRITIANFGISPLSLRTKAQCMCIFSDDIFKILHSIDEYKGKIEFVSAVDGDGIVSRECFESLRKCDSNEAVIYKLYQCLISPLYSIYSVCVCPIIYMIRVLQIYINNNNSEVVMTNISSEGVMKMNDKVAGLLEGLGELSISDVMAFANGIKEKFGLSDAMMAASAPVNQGASSDQGAATEIASDPVLNLTISHAGSSKVQVIKYVKEVTGKGLKDAKDIVDNGLVLMSDKMNALKEHIEKLQDLGCTVETKE